MHILKPDDKLKRKLEQIRTDLKYYREMSPENYINDRVLYKIKLYFLFGQRSKRWYNFIAILSVISGLLVPLFLNLDFKYSKEYATALTLFAGALIRLKPQFLISEKSIKVIKKQKIS